MVAGHATTTDSWTTADSVSIDWSFEESDVFKYRLISDPSIDTVIDIRIDDPMPEYCEVPPEGFLWDLDDWMEIPQVPVTITSSTLEEVGFENIFEYCGLGPFYWCRFALPESDLDVYTLLVERWTDGPYGTIEPRVITPPANAPYTYWGFEYGFEQSGTVFNVTAWYFAFPLSKGRLANVTILGHDSTTWTRTHYMMLMGDVLPPYLSSPEDMIFTLGASGKTLTWKIYEVPPVSYKVFRNETIIQSDSLYVFNPQGWIEPPVTVDLSDLEVGVWNFTIVATDFLMYTVSDTVMVTVESSAGISPDLILIVSGIGAAVIVVGVIILRRR